MAKKTPARSKRPAPPAPRTRPTTPAKPFPRIQATKRKPSTEPFTRPLGKPHGPAFPIRRRCPCCGYVVNDSRRFTWEHKFQTWLVTFGGRLPGGKGIIDYKLIDDPEYLPIIRAQVERLARRLDLLGGARRR